MTKTELNAQIGRIYYQSMTDAAGYPNGMMYWEDMSPSEKYFHTQTALQFIEMLDHQKLITINQPIGTGESAYNEGECKELLDHFKISHEQEVADLEVRIKEVRKMFDRTTDEPGSQ
jgi:hypothetical protein